MEALKKLLALLNPANAETTKSKVMNVVYAVVALTAACKAAYDYFSAAAGPVVGP